MSNSNPLESACLGAEFLVGIKNGRYAHIGLSPSQRFPDCVTSSPSPAVGVCSDQCREAATIGSVPTDGEGGFDVILTRLQSLSQREGLWPNPPGAVRVRIVATVELAAKL